MKRLDYVMIRLSKEEKQILQTNAEREGLTISAYVRYHLIKRGGK